MTEAEAKTKWCPFTSTGAYSDRGSLMAISVNRDPRPEVQKSCNCIASACMMWEFYVATVHGYCSLGKKDQ